MSDFAWRDLEGVDPRWPVGAPDLPNAPVPHDAPIITALEGPWGLPWTEGLENPNAPSMPAPSPNPQLDTPDVGWSMGPGAYRGEYRTNGPVQQFGLEPSGGLTGDQAVGRIMRFPVNIPDRYDANGVNVGDYRDLLAATISHQSAPSFTDVNVVEDLVYWDGNQPFAGWGT